MNTKKKNIIYALICILVGALFIFWLIPATCPSSSLVGDIQSSTLPTVMMAIILASGVILLLQALLSVAKDASTAADDGEPANPSRLMLVIILLAAYIFALDFIGFYSVTLAFLTTFLHYFNRPRFSWKKCLLITAVFLLCTYLLFEKGLLVKMPRGVFM